MKKILLSFITVALAFTGCAYAIFPSGMIVAQTRGVEGFEGISVANGIQVTIHTGTVTESVEVEADDNVMEYVETFVSKGTLFIKLRDGVIIKPRASIRVTVTALSVGTVAASGGSRIEFEGQTVSPGFAAALSGGSQLAGVFRTESAALSLSGGALIEGSFNSQTVALSMSGGSRAELNGAMGFLTLDCSGGSITDGFTLVCDEAVLSLSGGSQAYLTIDSSLIIRASGGSSLTYRGEAVIQEQSLSGGSTVRRQ